QVMKDRADYARKGIARGRSLVALEYVDGIALVAENPSGTLHKISEIYDRIGFAGVGKYNEFEMLKIAGIRHADVRGYSYSRADVTARARQMPAAQLEVAGLARTRPRRKFRRIEDDEVAQLLVNA